MALDPYYPSEAPLSSLVMARHEPAIHLSVDESMAPGSSPGMTISFGDAGAINHQSVIAIARSA
ncbi:MULTISPECIES: hypothetical protein [unclassified Bradyrhizobium]|uniref:hypothetical protein n=1 Tax=Bradyrhizobium TaxID=374 RepID=UPI002917022A|nr:MULTISPECIES: hypothetical protein [unclassified Bradyrhizobium]